MIVPLTDRKMNFLEIRGNDNNRLYEKIQSKKGVKAYMGIPNSALKLVTLDCLMQKTMFSYPFFVYSLN